MVDQVRGQEQPCHDGNNVRILMLERLRSQQPVPQANVSLHKISKWHSCDQMTVSDPSLNMGVMQWARWIDLQWGGGG